jgi:hypothetical protein
MARVWMGPDDEPSRRSPVDGDRPPAYDRPGEGPDRSHGGDQSPAVVPVSDAPVPELPLTNVPVRTARTPTVPGAGATEVDT